MYSSQVELPFMLYLVYFAQSAAKVTYKFSITLVFTLLPYMGAGIRQDCCTHTMHFVNEHCMSIASQPYRYTVLPLSHGVILCSILVVTLSISSIIVETSMAMIITSQNQ